MDSGEEERSGKFEYSKANSKGVEWFPKRTAKGDKAGTVRRRHRHNLVKQIMTGLKAADSTRGESVRDTLVGAPSFVMILPPAALVKPSKYFD